MNQSIKDAESFASAMNSYKETDPQMYMFWLKMWNDHRMVTKAIKDSTGTVRTQFVYGDDRLKDVLIDFNDLLKVRDEESYTNVIDEVIQRITPAKPEVAPQSTPDMLVNTGKTVVMQPVTEPVVETNVPVEEKVVTPAIERASTIQPKPKKPLTLGTPKVSSQSGFAEAIVLGVVVLVYIAIIVNLIIRLK